MLFRSGEIRIGAAIEDDETGIDSRLLPCVPGKDRVGVAAGPMVLFVDRDLVGAAEEPCGRKTGNACTDDRDLERRGITHCSDERPGLVCGTAMQERPAGRAGSPLHEDLKLAGDPSHDWHR